MRPDFVPCQEQTPNPETPLVPKRFNRGLRMQRWVTGLCLLFGLSAAAMMPTADYVEGDALVRFSSAETMASAGAIAGRLGLTVVRHYDWLSGHDQQPICLLHSATLTTAELLAELRAEPGVALAEPNFLRYPTDLRKPNDAQFGWQYGLQNTGQEVNGLFGTANADIGFLKAWGLARPATNEIVVGIIDSGIDTLHPDLVSNLWTNPGEIPGNGIDDDGDGLVDDIHGYDFSLGTGNLVDASDHGTHVAGIVAASGNNGLGVIGVDFQAHLMALKVASDEKSYYSTAAIIEAIQYAAMMKARGVNLVALNASYGGGGYNFSEVSAIKAAGDAGIVFVAAAGNSTNNNDLLPFYPASYRLPNMIVVGASDPNDALAYFSNYGSKTVDLAAPGLNIYSCLPTTLPAYTTSVAVSNLVFVANPFQYSSATPVSGITATIWDCGFGYPADFPAAVSNNIALIQRGGLLFADKVANAKAAGALAVIIFNNAPGNFTGTLQAPGNWIPDISLSQADGLALQAILPTTGTVLNTFDPMLHYQFLNGTSMAAPHVSAAVAFAAMNFPNESVSQRIQRILSHTTPVPALAGKTITGGRLNLAGIVDADNNGLPDWWELQYFGQPLGTDPSADPDGDGASNLAEFLAGTNPTNGTSVLSLSVFAVPGTNLVSFQWPSTAGRFYQLQRSTNLLNGFDTLIQTNLSATPPLNSATELPPPEANSVFYRLQLEPGFGP